MEMESQEKLKAPFFPSYFFLYASPIDVKSSGSDLQFNGACGKMTVMTFTEFHA